MKSVRRTAPSSTKQYGIAVLSSSLVVILLFFLDPVLKHDLPIGLSIVAVIATSWFYGLGPGLAATAVGMLGGTFLLMSPWDGSAVLSTGQVFRLLLFGLTGGSVSILSESLRRTTIAWQRAEQEKERLVLEERNRLAREIHDTLAQGLTGIILQLEAAEDWLSDDPDAVRKHLHRASNLARESLTEARRSVNALRPTLLEQRDLPETLRFYIDQITDGTGIGAELTVEGPLPHSSRLTLEIQSELLRIALEAVTNAVKHAAARHIGVTLSFGGEEVRLAVQDDGRGVLSGTAPLGTGFGLIAMRERAKAISADFNWNSRPGKGTEVLVTVPLPPSAILTKNNHE